MENWLKIEFFSVWQHVPNSMGHLCSKQMLF